MARHAEYWNVAALPLSRASVSHLIGYETPLSSAIHVFIHDPLDPVGRLLFNVLAMVAEFESHLIRARTREEVHVAKAKGRLRGKQPNLAKSQEAHLVSLHRGGQHTTAEIAELFKVPSVPYTEPSNRQACSPAP